MPEKKKNIFKRIGAGLLAGTCAFLMLVSDFSGVLTAAAASTSAKVEFPSADTVIAKAATLLGSPYNFGKKGYSDIYTPGNYGELSLDYVRGQGVDCSGLIYYTMTKLGFKTDGFDFQNPVPVDTMHWLTVNDSCTVTYNGTTSKVNIENRNVPSDKRPYWQRSDGTTITPGSVVIAQNPGGIDHAWLYIGKFDSRAQVVEYLKKIGVPQSLITSRTVYDDGSGSKHWRIEARDHNGDMAGVVINNSSDGKDSTAMNMYSFRITQTDVTFSLIKLTKDTQKAVGKSPVDNSSAVYGVYSDKSCTKKVAQITIGSDGRGSVKLSNGTYYAKEIKAPTGYSLDTTVYTLKANDTINVSEDYLYGSIVINKTAEDGIIGGREFKVTWTDLGKSHSKTAKTNSKGIAVFDDLRVYDMSSGKAISYTVAEINVESRYVTPKAKNVTLTSGDKDLTVTMQFDNISKKGSIKINKQSDDGDNGDRTFVVTGNGKSYTIKTSSSGIAQLNKIPVYDSSNNKIKYTISEKNVPIKYVVPADQTVTLTADATTDVTFENKLKKGSIKINKTSEDGYNAQRKFRLTWTENGGSKSKTAQTNANGIAEFKDLFVYNRDGSKISYTVSEIDVPDRYTAPKPQTVTLTDGGTVELTTDLEFYNAPVKGSIRINKTSDDGYNGGREFQLTWTDGEKHTLTAKTDSKGIAVFRDLYVYSQSDNSDSKIVYTISEINVPEKYYVPDPWTGTLRSDGVTDLTTDVYFANVSKKGSIEVRKQSEDNLVQGVEIRLSWIEKGKAKSLVQLTDANGYTTFSDLLVYDPETLEKIVYTAEEMNTDEKYVVPQKIGITLPDNGESRDITASETIDNILKKFTVKVVKTDAETGNAQGDGTLAGAVYGIYRGGELVDSYTTDENGYFRTKEYVCGNYTIKEIEPSEGYLLDETEYDVGAEAKKYTVEHNVISKTVSEQPIKGNIAIVKHTDNGDTQIETPEVGAEFEIYLKSAGSYESAKDSEKDYLTTNENGYAKSKDMPYGVYVVHQVVGADGAEKIADFEVVIAENKKTYRYIINNKAFESYVKVVKADAETGKTIAYAGAEFEIYDSEGNKVSMTVTYPAFQVIDTFCTDSTGSLVTPDVLPYGDYTLVEVTAPYGYVADSTPVPFTISEETVQVEQEIRIARVVKSDVPQKGRITVQKTGEVFSTVTKQDNMYTPVFGKGNLAGAVFEIRAAEDIVTADGTVRLKKGDAAATLTTDKNGYAESGELYLGKYTVTELTAPFGYVLNTDIQTVELVYAGQEAAVADTLGTEFFNAYQGVRIHLAKFMEHDDLYNVGGKYDVKNVTFGLFAAEEIEAADGNKMPANGLVQVVSVGEDMTAEFNAKIPFGKYYVQEISTDEKYVICREKYLVAFEYAGQDIQAVDIDCGTFKNVLKRGSVHGKKLDENGEPLANAVFGLFRADTAAFTKDDAIAVSTSDENGSFAFENIPYGKYIAAEIAAPTGYVFSDKKYDVVIDEDGDAVEMTAENKSMTIKISKQDVYGKELAGAKMQLIDSEGKTVDEWISDGTDHVVTKLPAGKYTLREVASPEGYVISTDIVFEIDVYNVVTVENVEALSVDENGIPTITMVDDTTKVSISKQDITNGKELSGATLQIIDENGDVIEEWISSDEPHFIEGKLIAGETYTLHEEVAPNGYVVATDIQFTVNEDGTVTEVIMKDERIPEKPKTPDDHTPKTGEDMPCGSLLIALVCASAMIIIRKIQRKEDVYEN